MRTRSPVKARACSLLQARTRSPLRVRACSPLMARACSPQKVRTCSPLKATGSSTQGSTLMRKHEIDSLRGSVIPNSLDVVNLCT